MSKERRKEERRKGEGIKEREKKMNKKEKERMKRKDRPIHVRPCIFTCCLIKNNDK